MTMRPDLQPISQLPISVFAEWDKNGQIRAILAQLDWGNFNQAAILMDAIMRDDRIYGVTTTRTGAVFCSPLDVKPANDSTKAGDIAEEVGGSDEEPGCWDEMFPTATLEQIATDGLFLGIGVGELIWDTSDPKHWKVRLKRWHPQFVYWDWGTYGYKINTGQGVIDLPNTDQQLNSDGKWFVWCPFGYQYGWLRCLLRALATLYLARQWDWRDWLLQAEKNGSPVDKVYVPEGAEEQDKDEFFLAVANRGSNTAVRVPVTAEGRENGFDFVLEEAKARTWECFKDLMLELNSSIAIAVLGQNMTTESSGAGLNAGGVASVQNQVRLDKRKQDAKIAVALRQQVLTWWAQFNYKDPELAPRPSYQVEPPEDELAEATALKTLGEALKALEDGGLDVDVRAVGDQWGVPMLTEEELSARQALQQEKEAADWAIQQDRQSKTVVKGAEPNDGSPTMIGQDAQPPKLTPSTIGSIMTVNEARALSGLPPLTTQEGAVDPDGDLLIAEYQAKHAEVIGDAARADAGLAEKNVSARLEKNAGKNATPIPPKGKPKPKDTAQATLGANHPAPGPVKRYEFAGLPLAIENLKGTRRFWYDPGSATPKGSTEMQHDYGFVEGHAGADGEELDVYVGPDEAAPMVHIVHQLDASRGYKTYDEDKIFLGFPTADAARAAFAAHRSDADQAIQGMSSIPLDRFKARLRRRSGTGKITATDRPDELELVRAEGALMALADRSPAVALSARGRKRSRHYSDRLVGNARRLAAKSLAVDLVSVRAEVEKATSFEDLKRRVVRLYADKMKPEQLAKVVEKANVMAHLAGRLQAVKAL